MSKRPRYFTGLLVGLVLIALILVLGVALAVPRLQISALQAEVTTAVMTEANAVVAQGLPGQPAGDTIVSDVQIVGDWAFGFLVTRAPDPALQIHAEPDIRLFISKRDESTGDIDASLEYTPEFYALLDRVPAGLIPQDGLDALKSAASVARGEEAIGLLNFALPWQPGQTWTMTGGPHPDSGVGSARPWSALDLAYGPGVGVVRAAESGVVWRSSDCPNFIRVDHVGGYRTGYYHVVNERVSSGQTVIRGDALAEEGMGTGCGGYTTGPHVHFSLRYFDTRINMAGNQFAGWQVIDGSSPYNGCMLRLRDNTQMCTPRAQITYEEGVLPVISDLSYDYNLDARPDLWVVDLRPSDGGTVVISIYDGSGFTSAISVPRSSLPPQPIELNTAFAAGDYSGDGTPDLWLFHRRFDTSNTTALRILDGENPAILLQDTPTALPPFSDDVRFGIADYNRDGTLDIYAVVPDFGTNTLRVTIVDGSSPMSLLGERVAAMPAPKQFDDITFALADYNGDGRADLWAINPRDAATNSVSVTVLSGNAFTNPLAASATALPIQSTDPERFSFSVTDYNRDGTPDLWHLDRKSGALTILSGKNFATALYDGPTGVRAVSSLRYQVLGADHARLLIPPQAPRLLGPPDGTTVIDPSLILRYAPSGLAKSLKVKISDSSGTVIASGKGPKNTAPACSGNACSHDTSSMGLILRDGQTLFWNVTAKNAYGETVSATRSFNVDLPGPVSILSPLADATLSTQPQFEWATRPTAESYTLVLKTAATGTKSKLKVFAQSCTASCAVTVGVPLANGQYWVRVVSKDAQGGTSKSPKHHFTLVLPPPSATPNGTLSATPAASNTLTPSATYTLTATVDPFATLPPPSPVGFRSP